MRKFVTTAVGALIAFALLTPASLSAQACIGSTAPDGSGVFLGSAAFTDGANSYGVTGGGNFEGPMFASGTISYADLDVTDEAQWGIGAQVGAEAITATDLSLCLDGSLTHTWITEFDIDGQIYEADASIGYPAGSEDDVLIVPNGSIGVVHNTVNAGGLEGSDTAAQFTGGVTIGSRSFFVGVDVSYATFEDSDAVFGVGVGTVF